MITARIKCSMCKREDNIQLEGPDTFSKPSGWQWVLKTLEGWKLPNYKGFSFDFYDTVALVCSRRCADELISGKKPSLYWISNV